MAEGLGEVAQELFAVGINLLSEKADIVDEGSGPFEDGAGPRRCPARTRASQKVHRRPVTRELGPDWDLSKHDLREAWDAGRLLAIHGWDSRSPQAT